MEAERSPPAPSPRLLQRSFSAAPSRALWGLLRPSGIPTFAWSLVSFALAASAVGDSMATGPRCVLDRLSAGYRRRPTP